jgi:hypothetical protein
MVERLHKIDEAAKSCSLIFSLSILSQRTPEMILKSAKGTSNPIPANNA